MVKFIELFLLVELLLFNNDIKYSTSKNKHIGLNRISTASMSRVCFYSFFFLLCLVYIYFAQLFFSTSEKDDPFINVAKTIRKRNEHADKQQQNYYYFC